MADTRTCRGHSERIRRTSKKNKLAQKSCTSLERDLKVLVKLGPVSVETSLKELEEKYASKPEWKVIKEGGVLSVPVEEFRMINPPKPDHSGKLEFGKRKDGGEGKHIDSYPVCQTIDQLNKVIEDKFNEVFAKSKAAGKSDAESKRAAESEALKLPQYQAVQRWQDHAAEIKVKEALGKMMRHLKIPTLIIRSVNLKALSALKDLGLELPGDAEIDLLMAYASGDFLHICIFEVKRANTYPWENDQKSLNKQALNKAELQLNRDLEVLMSLLADIPPTSQLYQLPHSGMFP